MSTSVLIVEDDKALCGAIARIASRWGDEVFKAHSVAEALELLEKNPRLMIVDVRLPDGTAHDVVEAASRRRPVPTMVAISGGASPEESFRLAQAGVRAFLDKPLGADELTAKVEGALREAPELGRLAVAAVGTVPLREAQGEVRSAMMEQALGRSQGNLSEAARLLQVTRQAVQQMVHGRDHKRPGGADPPPESE